MVLGSNSGEGILFWWFQNWVPYSPCRILMESTRSLLDIIHGIHETLFQESPWSPHISESPFKLYVESMKTPHRLVGSSRNTPSKIHGLHRLHIESPQSPHGLHGDSTWTPWGVHGNPWVSVKCSTSQSVQSWCISSATVYQHPFLNHVVPSPGSPVIQVSCDHSVLWWDFWDSGDSEHQA